MLKLKSDLCKEVAGLMKEIAKLPHEVEDNKTSLGMSMYDFEWTIICSIRESKHYVNMMQDEVKQNGNRTSEYDTKVNKDLGILGGV